jgi:hypothetical protein
LTFLKRSLKNFALVRFVQATGSELRELCILCKINQNIAQSRDFTGKMLSEVGELGILKERKKSEENGIGEEKKG